MHLSRACLAVIAIGLLLRVHPALGIVSWWPAEGDASDIADSNPGTLHDGTTFAPGVVGTAFSFDGVDDGVNVADAEQFNFRPSFSLTYSIRVVGYPSFLGQFIFRGDDRGGLAPYWLGFDSLGRLAFHIESYSDIVEVKTSYAVPIGDFLHVRATLNDFDSQVRLYINDILVAATTTNVRPLKDLDPGSLPGIGIGNHPRFPGGVQNHPFHGLIDELQISTLCGDGIIDPGEGCDDANEQGGDGCSSLCQLETATTTTTAPTTTETTTTTLQGTCSFSAAACASDADCGIPGVCNPYHATKCVQRRP